MVGVTMCVHAETVLSWCQRLLGMKRGEDRSQAREREVGRGWGREGGREDGHGLSSSTANVGDDGPCAPSRLRATHCCHTESG